MAAAPLAARIAGNELADPLRNYGHLVIRAAIFARERLDGRFVINRATVLPIGFSWEHGLKQALASGAPPELLLAVPALPALLTWGHPIGVLADPQRRPDARQLHVFAAAMELAGRRTETRIVVREERSGNCFFDRFLLCATPSLQWSQGLNDGDWGPCANNERSRVMRAVLRPPERGFAGGGDTSAADATTAKSDESPATFGDFAPDNRAMVGGQPPLGSSSPALVSDAAQRSASNAPSPTERAVAAQRFNALDAAADRLEQHIDEAIGVARILPAAGSEVAPQSTTDFPLDRTPDQSNPALAAVDAPAVGASASHDDAGGSRFGWVEDLFRAQDPFYSLHKWELNRALTAAADEGQSLAEDEIRTSPFSYDSSGKLIQAAREQLDRPRVATQINTAMYGTEDPPPSNVVERYLGRVAGGFGANPVLGAIFPWATTSSELLGEGTADFNKAFGSPLAEWQARFIGNVAGGVRGVPGATRVLGQGARAIGTGIVDLSRGLVPRASSWLGEVAQRFAGARRSSARLTTSDEISTSRVDPSSAEDAYVSTQEVDPQQSSLANSERTPGDLPNRSPDLIVEDVPKGDSQPGDSITAADASSPKWQKIDYRGSDLAESTYQYRRQNKVSVKRNVAGFSYEAPDGSTKTLFAASKQRVKHAEQLLVDALAQNKIQPSSVTEIYSELEPCSLPGAQCATLLRRIFPQAKVT